jgi:hypothetical protein
MLLLTMAGSSTRAGDPPVRTTGLSVGYRLESNSMPGGLTGSAFAEKQLLEGLAAFGGLDLHRISSEEQDHVENSFGIGGWVGLKLRVRPRDPGLRISPGAAIGILVFPSGTYERDQFTMMRISVELTFVRRDVSGLIVEFSVLQTIFGDGVRYGSSPDPLIALRVGLILRSL